ncbi:MAG: FAD-dependent oxidoreductase, partial [Clostridia bacterium]|nr:FAD-dependent oxidoreductase [Clostridia bacterium]
MINNSFYDAIVVGAGHSGVEASLALARLNKKVLLVTLSLDSISFMACNPNIGGTAKGHLVREVDALGGQMGISADQSLLQLRMLNLSKGSAVHSLRGQEDKTIYHLNMKKTIESEPNITLLQGEVAEILTDNSGKVCGIKTGMGSTYHCKAVVICSGVYLNANIVIGEYRKDEGPSGFSRSGLLTKSLLDLGINIRRFKTGTPAR